MDNVIVYDFGGGECPLPYDLEEDNPFKGKVNLIKKIVVVDVMKKEEWERWMRDELGLNPNVYEYVQCDLSREYVVRRVGERADIVNVSRLLRTIVSDGGYLYGKKLHIDSLIKKVTENIDDILKPKGIVRIYDHLECMAYVISELLSWGYTLVSLNIQQYRDEDYPAEWEAILERTL